MASRCSFAARENLDRITGLPDYNPVSVPFVAEEWQPFLLAGDLSPAPATYPEVLTERTAPAPLFDLAPHVLGDERGGILYLCDINGTISSTV